MDQRLTNGLAWAGVVLVCAVPAADFVMQRFSAPAAMSVSAPVVAEAPIAKEAKVEKAPSAVGKDEPAKTAEAKPVARAKVAEVEAPKSSRPMPSYISDAEQGETIADIATAPASKKPAAPAATPPVAETAKAEPQVVIAAPESRGTVNVPAPERDVASLPEAPQMVAPIPMPASMRPKSVPVPSVDVARAGDITSVNDAGYDFGRDIVTADDLEDWETGPLSEFLAQRRGGGDAAPRSRYAPADNYDPDGFFLSEGPNRNDPVVIYPFGR